MLLSYEERLGELGEKTLGRPKSFQYLKELTGKMERIYKDEGEWLLEGRSGLTVGRNYSM